MNNGDRITINQKNNYKMIMKAKLQFYHKKLKDYQFLLMKDQLKQKQVEEKLCFQKKN